jgi:hypothetical protein
MQCLGGNQQHQAMRMQRSVRLDAGQRAFVRSPSRRAAAVGGAAARPALRPALAPLAWVVCKATTGPTSSAGDTTRDPAPSSGSSAGDAAAPAGPEAAFQEAAPPVRAIADAPLEAAVAPAPTPLPPGPAKRSGVMGWFDGLSQQAQLGVVGGIFVVVMVGPPGICGEALAGLTRVQQ